jgi:hypothetical protein
MRLPEEAARSGWRTASEMLAFMAVGFVEQNIPPAFRQTFLANYGRCSKAIGEQQRSKK